ncbi:MAG: hypothetical protein NTV92_04185 [Candidatus Bipolaricaulota bacterium]|nr:hypothetical protein [Candidatus Bipolaricaulota bacterium]
MSKKDANTPEARPASTASMAFAPTYLIAPKPKRIAPSRTGANALELSLMSGGRTAMPSWRHSPMYSATLSESPCTLVKSPAMKWVGWCAFRYAVQYETKA